MYVYMNIYYIFTLSKFQVDNLFEMVIQSLKLVFFLPTRFLFFTQRITI